MWTDRKPAVPEPCSGRGSTSLSENFQKFELPALGSPCVRELVRCVCVSVRVCACTETGEIKPLTVRAVGESDPLGR